jgi:DNA-binding response OmpR family regulator
MVRTLQGGRHANLGIPSTLSQRSGPADPPEVPIWHHSDMERGVTGTCVLVVEDEAGIREVLAELLRRDGFAPHTCATGAAAVPAVAAMAPEVVLLDLGLPDVNGFDLLRSIRSRTDAAIIVLSGRASESDRVLALELGADDYVVKPFLTRELVARIRAHLRRAAARVDRFAGPLAVGDVEIDPLSREVTVAGEPVSLTAREFDLLHFLASSPRQVFSRDQILEHAWGSSIVWQQDATVTEHVHRLRQKVGADRIVTVRGVGYRFEPRVPAHVAE